MMVAMYDKKNNEQKKSYNIIIQQLNKIDKNKGYNIKQSPIHHLIHIYEEIRLPLNNYLHHN